MPKIKCIDNNCHEKELTVGKWYDAKRFESGGSWFYKLQNDKRKDEVYRAYRFEEPLNQKEAG